MLYSYLKALQVTDPNSIKKKRFSSSSLSTLGRFIDTKTVSPFDLKNMSGEFVKAVNVETYSLTTNDWQENTFSFITHQQFVFIYKSVKRNLKYVKIVISLYIGV